MCVGPSETKGFLQEVPTEVQHTALSCTPTCWKRLILGIETHW